MKLVMTGCVHCGAYTSSVEGICAECRVAREAPRAAPAVRRRERRLRVRKSGC
jgi:hypothetical protein